MKSLLVNELVINYKFIRRDIFAIVFPGSLFAICALLTVSAPPLVWVNTLGLLILCFWFMLSFFCISNQITAIAIDEDRINKPDRPVASGLVSVSGGQWRLLVSGVVSLLLAQYLAITLPVLMFLVVAILHNYVGLGNHWLTKNLLVALGIFSLLSAGWQSVAPIDESSLYCIGFVSAFWLFFAHIQDLRDIEGDRLIGRRTLPIIIGEDRCRAQLSVSFVLFPFMFMLVSASVVWGVIFSLLSLVLAARVMLYRSSKSDDKSYSIFLGMYCLLIVSFITNHMA